MNCRRLGVTLLVPLGWACAVPEVTYYDADATLDADTRGEEVLADGDGFEGKPTDSGAGEAVADAEAEANQLDASDAALDQVAAPDGPCTPLCADGVSCKNNGECESMRCMGTCQPPGCAPHCNPNSACGADSDCSSGVCDAGKCQNPACSPLCIDGQKCGANQDCASMKCQGGCLPPTCAPTCNDYAQCGANGDCASKVCSATGQCQPPACAPNCPTLSPCGQPVDCLSKLCMMALCK
jgi:hypothetical protein